MDTKALRQKILDLASVASLYLKTRMMNLLLFCWSVFVPKNNKWLKTEN